MMKKESTTSILVALIIAVALFAGGGYLEGGLTVALTRASIIGGIIVFAVGIYFTGIKFFNNHIDTVLITAVIMLREPEISKKSVQDIETMVKGLQESINTIKKVLH